MNADALAIFLAYINKMSTLTRITFIVSALPLPRNPPRTTWAIPAVNWVIPAVKRPRGRLKRANSIE